MSVSMTSHQRDFHFYYHHHRDLLFFKPQRKGRGLNEKAIKNCSPKNPLRVFAKTIPTVVQCGDHQGDLVIIDPPDLVKGKYKGKEGKGRGGRYLWEGYGAG